MKCEGSEAALAGRTRAIRNIARAIMVGAILTASTAAAAADTEFDRGLKLYQDGNYEAAAKAFETATERDPKSSVAQLYIGLSLYKLKRYDEAGIAFDRAIALDANNGSALLFRGLTYQATGAYDKAVAPLEKAAAADPDLAQLALYNLGISRYRMGDNEAAKTALSRTIELDGTSDTAADARAMLAKIEGAESKTKKRWKLGASVGYQYDDNVTTDEIDVSSNLQDTAFVFQANASYKLLQGEPVGLEAGYDFYQSLYDEQSDFDLQSHTLSLYAEKEISGVDTGLLYLYTRSLLGGDDFLGIHSVTPSVGYAFTPRWYANFSYNFQDKNFITNNDRDATLHGLGMNNFLFFMDGKAYLSFGYRIESEDAKGPEFDYLGHFFHAKVRTPIPLDAIARWNPMATVGWAYFVKNYANDTPAIADERKDKRTTLTLDLTADVTQYAQAKFSYERIEAISNLASSDFNENIVTFSVGVKF